MRILVIEDEQHIAAYLETSLKAEGFQVDVATDGLTGLDMALSGAYSAITLDILLPGMNGYRVCEELRAAGIDTPILMLTAKDGEYDEADALDMGADNYLSKPFSLVVLVARLRALLRRRGQGQARARKLEVEGICLDPASRTVTREDEQIELTPREFALLEYLMYNAGTALAKTEILNHVWDANYMGDENVVEVYIGYLRKKVDAPFSKKTIQTVSGAGYKIAGRLDGRGAGQGVEGAAGQAAEQG